ncbi:MAG: SH3 domain-containing protein, partial [Sarcina sp.]
MGRNRIATILVSAGLLAGGLGIAHHPVQQTNNQVKNVRLLTNNSTNNATFGCVINGNGNLTLTNKNGQTSSYLSVGQMLKLGQTQGNKTLVTVEETGVSGYINNSNIKYVTSGVNNSMTRMNRKGFVINVTTSVHLRSEATMNSNIIENLPNNASVTITGKQGNWFRVNINGVKGFIFDEYVAEGNAPTNANNISAGNIISNTPTSTTTGSVPMINNNSSNTNGTIVNIPLKVSPIANNSTTTTSNTSASQTITNNSNKSNSITTNNSTSNSSQTITNSNSSTTKTTPISHNTGNTTSGTTNTKPSTSNNNNNNTPAKTTPVSHNTGNTTSGTTNTKPSTSNNNNNNTPAKTTPVSHNTGNTT